MHIAMIGQKGIPAQYGGVERHVHDLSVRLVQEGFRVVVYARKWYSTKGDNLVEGVEVKFLPSIKTKHLDTISHTFLATVHAIRSRADIIHYHGVGPSLWSWIPRIFFPNIKVVTTFHSIDRKHEKWNFLARTVLRVGEWSACKFAHRTIAVSRTIRQYARDAYDANTEYIPNATGKKEKTKKYNLLLGFGLLPKKYVLMVSRLIPHKGAHYLVAAYNRLQQTSPELTKHNKLVIVGDGHYTYDYVESLRVLAYGNPDIIFTGFRAGETLQQLFSHAKLMVHPSDKEGMPITVLEGMSYSLPILLSDIPEHMEFVDDPDYLFSHGQIHSLKDRLKDLVQKPASELSKQGKKNLKKITSSYSWDTVIEQMVSLYQDLQTVNAGSKQERVSMV
jgi:glycosyltransferase involved in cell wall biosynthesis